MAILPKHLQTGRDAEARACAHLQHQGLLLLTRNYRCTQGELDLVMEHGPSVVFVEVRYRADDRFGSAADSVTLRKQAKVRAAAQHYLLLHPALAQRPCRFDVMAVAPTGMHWLRDAF